MEAQSRSSSNAPGTGCHDRVPSRQAGHLEARCCRILLRWCVSLPGTQFWLKRHLPGRYVKQLLLERNPLIKVAALAHPSALKVPDDLHAIHDKAPGIPTIWLVCERDGQFPPDSQEQADQILGPLGGDKYKKVYYADNDHGFAVKVGCVVEGTE